ncbi:MAG: hypothetical protein MOP51_273, partial [Citricoccus sp.]|nr:hypothetical protein [Citricoccus sp. WCRC_4]
MSQAAQGTPQDPVTGQASQAAPEEYSFRALEDRWGGYWE